MAANLKTLPPPANDPAARETREDRKRRLKREGMRRCRERAETGVLVTVMVTWNQVDSAVRRGQIPPWVEDDPPALRREFSNIVAKLTRREFSD